jgi:hypothetical protein
VIAFPAIGGNAVDGVAHRLQHGARRNQHLFLLVDTGARQAERLLAGGRDLVGAIDLHQPHTVDKQRRDRDNGQQNDARTDAGRTFGPIRPAAGTSTHRSHELPLSPARTFRGRTLKCG